MNVSIVHDKLDTMSGAATRRTSRPPLGRVHHVWPVQRAGSSSVMVPPVPSGDDVTSRYAIPEMQASTFSVQPASPIVSGQWFADEGSQRFDFLMYLSEP